MKIPIKIQGKKYNIKPIVELTTSEFIELNKIEDLDYVKYIAWQTKVKFKDAFFTVTSKSVEDAIGIVPDIKKLPKSMRFNYDLIISTVGLRHQVERSRKEGYELLVYILAVSQAQSMNDDTVQKLYDKYMIEPFTEILPAGFFFFRRLQPGRNFAANSLKRLWSSIKIRSLKKQLGLKS